jgi:hypothetical protein
MWCVECVVEGELDVTLYDLVERDEDRYRFERRRTVRAGVGQAGQLIPPFEYHTLRNPSTVSRSVTLHVYGGEMAACSVYQPSRDGWYTRGTRPLRYDQ